MEVIDFPKYKIYKDGRVFSEKSKKFLKTQNDKKGYLRVVLYHNGKKKSFKLHRLLAIHFIPNPDNLPCVDHIDRNKQNNEISNLRWASYSTNNRNKGSKGKIPHKHISQYRNKYYRVHILDHNKLSFKTLEEAIKYRDDYLENKIQY